MTTKTSEYKITWRADVEGDWTDEPAPQRFASEQEAKAWWDAHYRGPDEFGNQAYPAIVLASTTTKAKTYTVCTDSFMLDDFEADNLNDAIEQAFCGEIGGIVDEDSLHSKFAKYVRDGGWCWIEEDGERVLEIGEC